MRLICHKTTQFQHCHRYRHTCAHTDGNREYTVGMRQREAANSRLPLGRLQTHIRFTSRRSTCIKTNDTCLVRVFEHVIRINLNINRAGNWYHQHLHSAWRTMSSRAACTTRYDSLAEDIWCICVTQRHSDENFSCRIAVNDTAAVSTSIILHCSHHSLLY